jgi:hypothetical protein
LYQNEPACGGARASGNREGSAEESLPSRWVWEPYEGWQGYGLIDAPIFNYAIYETGQEEDPEAYNAEINIKGKIIYSYTWNPRNLNQGQRITA